MDWSGLPVPYIAGGLAALILIVLMLRFALRPKRVKVTTQTGLGLPSSSPKNSLWGKSNPSGKAEAAAAAAVSNPAWSSDVPGSAAARAGAGDSGGYGAAERGREGIVTGSPAEPAELAKPAATARGTTSKASGARDSHSQDGCPKCGGRFLQGEMEGPTLMVDGVVREDFQPLLTAHECSACGYLEFYTRPARH